MYVLVDALYIMLILFSFLILAPILLLQTLGYTGRPGGPDFYINKSNNTIPHGPGGQVQHGIQEQADSCFASIVQGQEVINKIYTLPTHPPSHQYAYFFIEPIEIANAQIMTPPTPTSQGQANTSNNTPRSEKTTTDTKQNAQHPDK